MAMALQSPGSKLHFNMADKETEEEEITRLVSVLHY